MSISLTNAAVAEFNGMVHNAYQLGAHLPGTVRRRSGVVGKTHTFPVRGKGVAYQKTSQADLQPMNIGYNQVTATLVDLVAPEFTDIFDQAEVNFDDRQGLAETVALAIGRAEDQQIINAMVAGATPNVVANGIGGANSGLNMSKLRDADRQMGKLGVPRTERCFAASHDGKAELLADTEATSGDYQQVLHLVSGQIPSLLGFQFEWIEERAEGGLPKDGNNDRTNFAYHREAVGHAVGMEPTTEINYLPRNTSWLVTGKLKCGSVTIDTDGLVQVTTREAA